MLSSTNSSHMDKSNETDARFVSGGSLEKPNERDQEWYAAELALEAERSRQAQLGKQHGGMTLYEALKANRGEENSLPTMQDRRI
jgi:FAM192A/Fyv6, N-terminal domain